MGKTGFRIDRDILKLVMPLAWPTIIEQALQTIVQFIDSAMVGRISAKASAAVGVTTSATWLLNGVMFAAGVGVLAVISRAIGAGDYEKAQKASVQAVLMSGVLGLLVGGFALLIGDILPALLGAAPDIQADASIYFKITCGAMVVRSFIIILGSVLRATGDMRSPMLVNMTMNFCNIILNFFLIYSSREILFFGNRVSVWGAGMGVTGAATATAVSFVIGCVMMIVTLYKSNRGVSPIGMKLRPDREVLKQCITISVPNAMERITVCLGQIVFTALVASLGTIPLAAHSIAITAEQAFYVPGFGFQAAATTLSGQALGEKNERKIVAVTQTIMIITVATMFITGLLLFLFPNVMMQLFTTDPAVIEQGAVVLRIVSISEPFFAVSLVIGGMFNGIGDTKPPFIISMSSMWGVRILLTFFCVKVFGLGLAAVWCCMVADIVTKSLLMTARYKSGKWKEGFRTEQTV